MAERSPADGTTNGGGGVHTRGHATGADSRPVRRTVPDEDGFTEPPSDTRRHRRVGSTGAGSHATAQARDAASPGLAPSTTDDLKRRIQARIDKHQARLRAQKNAIIAAGAVSDPVASPGRTESFGSPQRSARKSVAGEGRACVQAWFGARLGCCCVMAWAGGHTLPLSWCGDRPKLWPTSGGLVASRGPAA